MSEKQLLGPVLKGWTPPFTPTGNSAYWRMAGPGFTGVHTLHNGLFMRYEADAERLALLLPAPLQPTHNTGRVAVFVNQTVLLPSDPVDVATLEPSATRFHEAIIFFPCRLGDRELLFHYIMYTDSGWCVYCGVVAGLTTKLADIELMAPLPPHPDWRVDRPGTSITASVAREGARIMSLSFRTGQELDAAPVFADLTSIVAMRYFPDQANFVDGRPLVCDLITKKVVDFDPGRAYAGEGAIEFCSLPTEELDCFQPLGPVQAHYLTGLSQRNLGAVVIHDYLAR